MTRNRRIVIGTVASIMAIAGWYWFRPERAFLTTTVQEAMPAGETTVVRAGEFTSRAHDGEGLAQVVQLADGRRMLRFTRFKTLNGPDLQVYLLGSAEVNDGRALDAAGFVSLGELKGNEGDQNYEIPDGVDLARYPAVSVWCRRFAVNFTTAPLASVAGN